MPITTKLSVGGNGINYTKEVDSILDYGSVPADTYFKNLTDGLIYYKNASSDILTLFAEGITSSNNGANGLVAPDGNDASGTLGNMNKPFATLAAARVAATQYKKRRFTSSAVASTSITLDDGVNGPSTYTSNLGTTIAADVKAIVDAINGAGVNLVASQDIDGVDEYFYVEATDPTVPFDSTTTPPVNLREYTDLTIYVAPGTYIHDSSQLSVAGTTWYFHKGTFVTFTSTIANYIFDAVTHYDSHVLGYGSFLRYAGVSVSGIARLYIGSIFECDDMENLSTLATINVTGGPFYIKCYGDVKATSAYAIAVTSSSGFIEANLIEGFSTTSTPSLLTQIKCDRISGVCLLNSGSARIDARLIDTFQTVGSGNAWISGNITTGTIGSTHRIHSTAEFYSLSITGNCKLYGGIVVYNLTQSAGYIDMEMIPNTAITTNSLNFSGTAIAKLKVENYSSGTGCRILMNTGGSPEVYITGPSTLGSTPTASSISNGKLTVRGTFNLIQTTVRFINMSGTAVVDLTDCTINMLGVINTTTNNVAVLSSGNTCTLISNGATITTADPNISPIQSSGAALPMVVKSGGFNTNYTTTLLTVANADTGSGITNLTGGTILQSSNMI